MMAGYGGQTKEQMAEGVLTQLVADWRHSNLHIITPIKNGGWPGKLITVEEHGETSVYTVTVEKIQ